MTEEAKQDEPWIATLTRGRNYTLGTNPAKHFARGVDVPVTEALKKRLEEKAVDAVTVPSGNDDEPSETEYRAKFKFRKAGEPASADRTPRSRPRRVHQ